MEDDLKKRFSISFDPEDLDHMQLIKNITQASQAKGALFDFRHKLRRAMNKGEFDDYIINRVDEELRPTKEEVCNTAEVFWKLLDECFEEWRVEEFLRDE